MTNTDIILVGLGPTSAVLANLLAPLGWNIRIFEQNQDIYALPRAVFFDDEVMRILQQIGLSEEITACTIQVRGMDLINLDGLSLSTYEASKQETLNGWHPGYMFHQPTLESILRKRLANFSNVHFHLGQTVKRVYTTDIEAFAEVTLPGGSQTYNGKYLVGCCGSRSITRSSFSPMIKNYHEDQKWLVIDIELLKEFDLPTKTTQYCDPNRPSTYIPTPGLTRRFEIMLMPHDIADEIRAPDKISALLSKWLEPSQYRVVRTAVYEFHALVAKQWRNQNLFIAGDAAHQMPPFLGQGMCSGIKDAANLAWKLDFALRGFASDSILDTYAQERISFVEQVIESDLWLSSMIQTTDHEAARKRDLHFFSLTPAERKLEPPKIKLGGPYFKSPLSGELLPQPLIEPDLKYDDILGYNLILIGKISLNENMKRLIDSNILKVIETPDIKIQKWLEDNKVKAVLVRPDKYVQSSLNNSNDLMLALKELSISF